MSRNIETVQAIYDCFGRKDFDGVLQRLHPDLEWEHDWGGPTLKWYTPRRGRAEVPAFFQALAELEIVRFEPVAFLEGADMVAVPIQLELVVKANGNRVRNLEAHLWTFGADGLVTRFHHLGYTRQLALAVGA